MDGDGDRVDAMLVEGIHHGGADPRCIDQQAGADLLADPNPPKTQTRAFKVAQFVWENERVHGKRPPWPVLCERWNNSPFGQLAGTFDSWRDLRTNFVRGAKATPPRYIATNEQMTELVRSRSHQGAFDMWASKVRE